MPKLTNIKIGGRILILAGVGVVFAMVTRDWNAPFGFGPAIAVGALVLVLLPQLSRL